MNFRCLNCDAMSSAEPQPWLMAPAGEKGCKACGSRLMPGRRDDRLDVRIGWQELRLLVAMARIGVDSGADIPDEVTQVLDRLCHRLAKHRPEMAPPLTTLQLVAELRLMGIDATCVDGSLQWPP